MAARILIVDDHPGNLKLLAFAMGRSGYEVTCAADAQAALAALAEALPDLILLDLQMPGMSGFQLARLLRDTPEHAGIPIVAVTAYAMRGDEEKARAAGCDAYMAKPVDVQALRALVQGLLARG